jgi:hypothetical protein
VISFAHKQRDWANTNSGDEQYAQRNDDGNRDAHAQKLARLIFMASTLGVGPTVQFVRVVAAVIYVLRVAAEFRRDAIVVGTSKIAVNYKDRKLKQTIPVNFFANLKI